MIIGPFQTSQPGCSSLTDCCAVVKGRKPEDQLVELELALLPEQLVLAVAELLQVLKPVLQLQPVLPQPLVRSSIRSCFAATITASVNNFVTTSSQSLCCFTADPSVAVSQ